MGPPLSTSRIIPSSEGEDAKEELLDAARVRSSLQIAWHAFDHHFPAIVKEFSRNLLNITSHCVAECTVVDRPSLSKFHMDGCEETNCDCLNAYAREEDNHGHLPQLIQTLNNVPSPMVAARLRAVVLQLGVHHLCRVMDLLAYAVSGEERERRVDNPRMDEWRALMHGNYEDLLLIDQRRSFFPSPSFVPSSVGEVGSQRKKRLEKKGHSCISLFLRRPFHESLRQGVLVELPPASEVSLETVLNEDGAGCRELSSGVIARQFCSLIAHMDLTSEEMLRFLMIYVDSIHTVLQSRAETDVKDILAAIFVPPLRVARRTLHMASAEVFSKEKGDDTLPGEHMDSLNEWAFGGNCRPRGLARALVERCAVVLHLAVRADESRNKWIPQDWSLEKMAEVAFEKNEVVELPLDFRVISLRHKYLHISNNGEDSTPLMIVPLKDPLVKMSVFSILACDSIIIPPHRELRPLSDGKSGAKRVTVFPLSITSAKFEHYFLFDSSYRRLIWSSAIDSASQLGKLRYALSAATWTINYSAFLRNRFAIYGGLGSFKPLQTLGAGTFGRVLLVQHQLTRQLYAMKIINKLSFHSIWNLVGVRRELAVLGSLDIPGIVRLHASYQTDSRVYLVMDYAPGGEVQRLPKGKKGFFFNLNALQLFIAEIALILGALQEKGIVHRDIKGDNLLLTEDGHVLLSDFGLAKCIVDDKGCVIPQRTCCGTLAYTAPEMLGNPQERHYGFEVDWWSFGVVLFTGVTGHFPFMNKSNEEMIQDILTKPIIFPPSLRLDMYVQDIITSLLQKDPKYRLASLSQMQAHPFFKGFDWEACERRALPPPITHNGLRMCSVNPKHVVHHMAYMEEEDDQLGLVRHAYGHHRIPMPTRKENDIFQSSYAFHEANGSDREGSSSMRYTPWCEAIRPHTAKETDKKDNETETAKDVSPSQTPPTHVHEENSGMFIDAFTESAYASEHGMLPTRPTKPTQPPNSGGHFPRHVSLPQV